MLFRRTHVNFRRFLGVQQAFDETKEDLSNTLSLALQVVDGLFKLNADVSSVGLLGGFHQEQ